MRTSIAVLSLLLVGYASSRVISKNTLAQAKSLAQDASGYGVDPNLLWHDHEPYTASGAHDTFGNSWNYQGDGDF